MSAEPASAVWSSGDRIRDTAKWIVATFGAVAAVLVAGISIGDVGEVELWSDRFWAVSAGAAVATFTITWAITSAASVLVTNLVTLVDLPGLEGKEKDAAEYALALGPADSLEELKTKVPEHQKEASTTYAAYLNNRSLEATTAYQTAEARARAWSNGGRETVQLVGLERTRAAFATLGGRLWLIVPLTVLGVGVAAWGLGGSKVKTTIDVVSATPTAVVAELDAGGARISEFRGQLGPACVDAAISGVALAVAGDTYTIAVAPSDACQAAIIEIGPTDGEVGLPPKDG